MGRVYDNLRKQALEWIGLIRSIRTDFRPALYAYLIILIPSTILLPLPYVAANATDPLESSWRSPWEIFTSTWVHFDLTHYAGNMVMLFVLVILFAFIHEDYPKEEKLSRSKVLIWIPIVSAIAANVYTLFVLPLTSSAGASGAVFAYEGVCVGYAFLNWYPSNFRLRGLREHLFRKETRTTTFRSFVVFVVLFFLYVSDPRRFLIADPGVNVFAHLVGFVAGFALTGTYDIIYRYYWK